MVKNVKINVVSKQTLVLPVQDGDGEELAEKLSGEPMITEVESEGTLEYKHGTFTVYYPESEVTGLEGCVTSLSFTDRDPGSVSLYRTGPVKTVLMFAEGRRYISVYDTGFGSFEVGIVTLSCDNCIDENGGELSVVYTVEIKGSEAERTELKINVRCI